MGYMPAMDISLNSTDPLPSEDQHVRPHGVSDDAVAGVGKLTEALEIVERARGHLYEFHQLIGSADLKLDEAIALLARSGHENMADLVSKDLVGRNVIEGRWTFQIIEEFDDTYWDVFRHVERNVRNRVVEGRRHIYESEMKERRRSHGRAHHESRPTS
jgi:hypothetical protein